MARAPLQVLVLPFRRRGDGGIEYAIFRRADHADACWQGLAGGAEQGESAEQAAQREMTEEACIPADARLIPLDATASVPAVLVLKPIVSQLTDPARGWLLVAMASTLSGNLTILGSVANLIVVEAARSSGVRIGFGEYCRVGVPLN